MPFSLMLNSLIPETWQPGANPGQARQPGPGLLSQGPKPPFCLPVQAYLGGAARCAAGGNDGAWLRPWRDGRPWRRPRWTLGWQGRPMGWPLGRRRLQA